MSKNSSHCTVIIPNWNGGARLRRVLEDLGKQTERAARVLVVDNGSADESGDAAEDAGAEVVRLGENRGFAKAVNAGLERAADAPLVAILNNDVELPPDWLAQMTAGLGRYSDASFASGKIFSAQQRDRLDGTFDLVSRGLTAWRAGHGRPDGVEWNRERYIAAASLTAAVFRRDVFTRVGVLDERFGSYLEDVDLALRCALEGLTGVYLPRAVCYHAGSATLGAWSAETVRLMARNQVLLAAKFGANRHTALAQRLWGLLATRHGRMAAWRKGRSEGRALVASGEVGLVRPNAAVMLEVTLAEQERELRRLQEAGGAPMDWYWRLYFRLP
ncbi:MAG: glycosyltransferase family 2 protein [Bryobacterales bacterium]|nr:glycosyltransferase family 2 protein [Bryobacterales bacterium]